MGDLSLNFNRKEFQCQCGKCIFDTVDYELIQVLEDIRYHFNKPVIINSGSRCEYHNIDVGGSKNSMHLQGKAADVVVKNIHEDDVYQYLNNKYFNKYGIGRYNGRTHIDVRQKKSRWDNRKEKA